MSGLLALLDDVAALVKINAASLDDISAQVAKTGSKVSGIVIDDAAVTPKYVIGIAPKRELAIIFAIAKKSLFNKLVFLTPAALFLGFFLPWLIQPILMAGGFYLCFEGYEKLHEIFVPHHADETPAQSHTADELEQIRITSAVRTDLILSAEIIAITYYNVATQGLLTKIVVMIAVAIGITVAVYGFVGIIVKADDFGLWLARKSNVALQQIGRAIVRFMPYFLNILGYIGTAAMLWVGAEIIAHGITPLHHALEGIKISNATLNWLCKVMICATGGAMIGAVIAQIKQIIWKK